jgi:RNA polymerase sigma factor (sigma-70 family)
MANFDLTQKDVLTMIQELQTEGSSQRFDTLFKTKLLNQYKSIARDKGIPPNWVEDCNIDAIVNFQRALIRGKFTFEKEGADLEKFFKTIYSNYCISFIRKNWRELGVNEPDGTEGSVQEVYTEGLSAEATRKLKKAMEELCAKCRERLRLFYWRGLSHEEIAARMGQNGENPRTASSKALEHCKVKLKKILKSSKFSW